MADIRTVAETGSTNDDLAALARSGAPEGCWLRAERQTGGKGRQGRAWHSPPGNLHASTLVRLREADPPAPTLALVAAVALHEAVASHCPEVGLRIKWPNDLVTHDRKAGGGSPGKLAGILLERRGEAVVVGFGVNLAHHPDLAERAATSVKALTGSAPDAQAMAESLADSFARWLDRWRREGLAPVRAAWLAAAHPLGTPLATAAADGAFDGLDDDGALRLRLADGSVRTVHAGEVFLI